MWSVLRRYQGVDQQQASSSSSSSSITTKKQQQSGEKATDSSTAAARRKAFEHNQRTLALHEWQEHGKVDPNPSSLALPYDRYVYDKMLRLAAPNTAEEHAANSNSSSNPTAIVEIQRKALANLIQLLFEKPQNIHHLIKEPRLIPTIVTTTADPDEDVRRATCVLLRLIAQDRLGAAFLFNQKKDVSADENLVKLIAFTKKNSLSASSITSVTPDQEAVDAVRRRLADVGQPVRCLLGCAMDGQSSAVATEALRALAAFHGFADSPEYTFTLMNARCVPLYAEIIKSFQYANNNNSEDKSEQNKLRCCTAALTCLRLVTDAKEAYLQVLKEDVLDAALKIVNDYVRVFEQNSSSSSSSSSSVVPEEGKLLCAALSVITELVLYTAGSNAAARRRQQQQQQQGAAPTLLPCAKLARLHPDPAVRRDAAGALATLCVAETGKAAAYSAPQEQGVINLVKDSICHETNRDVVSCMCRTVCLLSELPDARQMLVDIAEPLQEIASNAGKAKDSSLEEGAARAAKLVVWVPGQE